MPQVEAARRAGRDIVMVGETHAQMPFMAGAAQVDPQLFDFVVDDARYDYDLFAPPNAALGNVDHAIGLHASALVRDGGTLQVGIGELGDALVYALLLRHQQNDAWRGALGALGAGVAGAAGRGAVAAAMPSTTACSPPARCSSTGCWSCIAPACCAGAPTTAWRSSARSAPGRPSASARTSCRRCSPPGPGRNSTRRSSSRCAATGCSARTPSSAPDGCASAAASGSMRTWATRRPALRMAAECLGRQLRNGQVLHAGFFLGPRGFYAALRDLPEDERAQFSMRGVGYVNQLYGADQELRILQRRDMRCINTAMMVTLLGAAVSDALENGQVVSGVGGQYNFVAMAHALPGARSILCVRATRTHQGRTTSNIVWNYAHHTIPRHLRDIVITEYGIAELRGRTDEEVIAALLNVADSRFQDGLLAQAQGGRQDPRRLPDPGASSATTCRNGSARALRAAAGARVLQ